MRVAVVHPYWQHMRGQKASRMLAGRPLCCVIAPWSAPVYSSLPVRPCDPATLGPQDPEKTLKKTLDYPVNPIVPYGCASGGVDNSS